MAQKKINLNLGCGVGLLSNFINVDAYFTLEELQEGAKTKKGHCANAIIEPRAEYVQSNILRMPFPDNHADYVLMNNVIEHFPMLLVKPMMDEVWRVMKPKAKLVVITPDFNCVARLWVLHIANQVGKFVDFALYKYIAEVAYGNQIGAGEFHCTPFTPDYLNYVLRTSGFNEVKVTMYQMHGAGPKGLKGVPFRKGAVMRTDNLVAECIKGEKS